MKTLRPRRYTETEFFIADEMEITSFRDELASMEHPFFALKGGDTKDREYKNGNVTVTVRGNSLGLATVFDKDIWIYAISKLQQAIFEERPISRTIAFTPYDFFMTTNRDKGGRSYEELKKSLSRLSGTRIQHNIKRSDHESKTTDFGLIDKWELLEKKKGKLDIGMIEVTLPDWLYQGVTQNHVLKISPDYFRIRKAIDRRLYEIARKHCGYDESFVISLEKLLMKVGSTTSLKYFRSDIKKLSTLNDLPDYCINFDITSDMVTFTNKNFDQRKADNAKLRTEKNKIIGHNKSDSKLPLKMQQRIDAIRKGDK
ncbi:RepB family plasmid replication initiator protein [Salmonella enterica]|uniref:replication initiator protein A n=1 Tax=Escherichia coli TaxID=562 RepID=UPI00138189F2|nr:replication initiator protein A [Escherichia coli]EBC1407492.1 RepB family plasmid replication initiator protein [Salmonella enterica]HAS9316979.1 replication initiator protein A [Salmonella enterica subsp. enterica serovar Anatum]ECZ6618570.1 replication initiator protein A [Salmonella enterica]EFQ4632120.1 replication initiator protein A [Salmonella enterica]EIY9232656.1 replication initiator protein A [Salmonella enterica]